MLIYGGISGVELAVEFFNLDEGVEIHKTYAYLFSPNMMAFAPPDSTGLHPAPWRAAMGGFSHVIGAEIRVPERTALGESFDAKETIWWIAVLLRLAYVPYLSVPVISTHSFSEAAKADLKPTLTPLETEGRIFMPGEAGNSLNEEQLAWVKEHWVRAGQLLIGNPKLYSAIKAFDAATLRGRTSASLLAMWGAIEQIFAPSSAELRFRVAALLSSYLELHGPDRLKLYKEILKLYNERSTAAHTAKEIESDPLVKTYVIMRNALIKIIATNKVPTQADLEDMLFCGDVSTP